MKKIKTSRIALSAVFAALMAVFSQIIVPTPWGIPITLQVFALCLGAYTLGSPSAVSVLVYVLLGMVGMPVFGGFQGGIGHILSYTGGFLWSFPLMALICGIPAKSRAGKILCSLAGLTVNYLCGTMQFVMISGSGWQLAFWFLPLLAKDVLLMVAAYGISAKIRPLLIDKI